MENQSFQKKKWYDNKTVVVLLCIFFFPIGLYALWKNRFISQNWKIRGTAIIGLLVIASIGGGGESTESDLSYESDATEQKTEVEAEPEKDPEVQLKEQLERELKSFEKPFDNSTYEGSVEAVQMELVLFGAWAKVVEEGEASEDEENQKLAKELRIKVEQRQAKEFPIMRKRYAEEVGKKLWENDIDVSTSGSKKNIINFTAGMFAANKNKKDFNDQVYQRLIEFRFKQSRYRWYKGQDEYTYWDMEVPNDKELVKF